MLESVNPQTGQVAPYTSTVTQPVSSQTSGKSTKEMSPEARAQLRAWLDATDAQERAQASAPPADTRTAADIAAEVASQEQSQIALDRAQVAAMPDPFQPPPPPVGTVTTRGPDGGMTVPLPAPPPEQPSRPFTSQEFAATPEMRGPQTLEAAKDEAAIYETQAKARLAKEQADSLAAQQAERARRQDAAMARINEAADQYQRLSDKLFEEPSTFSRIMGAVAMGLGAYGSALTGSPNYAYEIIKTNQQRDLDAKKLKLQGALERMKAAGTSFENIDKWSKTQQERLMAISKAQIGAVDASVSRMLAPFPKAQQEWAQKAAELKAENAAKIANFVQSATGTTSTSGRSNEGVKVTTVEGKEGGMGGRMMPGARDIEAAATAEVMEGKAQKLDELTKAGHAPTPEEIAQVHNNELQFLARTHAESKSTWANIAGQIGRGVNVFPDSIFPKGMKQETREWIRHQRDLWHSEAVALYGLGWLSTPENYAHVAEARAPKIGDTQADILEKGEVTSKQAHIQNMLFRQAGKPWRQVEKREADRARAAAASAAAPSYTPPRDKAEVQARLLGIRDPGERAKAVQALAVPKSDPRYKDADQWLKNRGLR